jgi:hypothetical protein
VFGVTPSRGEGPLNLSIAYESVTQADSEPLWLLNSTFLQIGNISVPFSDFWRFCISGIDQETCFDIESAKLKSLLFSVPSQGNYSIRGLGDGLRGFFETGEGMPLFEVSSNLSFILEAQFRTESSPSPTATEAATETVTLLDIASETVSHLASETLSPCASGAVSPQSIETVSTQSIGTVSTQSIGTLSSDTIETFSSQRTEVVSTQSIETVSTQSSGTMASGAIETISTPSIDVVSTQLSGTLSSGAIVTLRTQLIEDLSSDAQRSVSVIVTKLFSAHTTRTLHAGPTGGLSPGALAGIIVGVIIVVTVVVAVVLWFIMKKKPAERTSGEVTTWNDPPDLVS